MKLRSLGSTDLEVGAIGFGGVPLSVAFNRPSEDEAIAVIHHAVDCGVSFIDTADTYCLSDEEYHHNERLIAKALSQLPTEVQERVVVATKGGFSRPNGLWVECGRPDHIRRQCEGSLRALGVEQIDLYQHHRPDPDVAIAESLGEIIRLREEGKIRFVGVSEYSVDQLDEAQSLTDIVTVQNQFSVLHRDPEQNGVLEETRKRSLAFIPWRPLGGLPGARILGDGQQGLREVAAERGVSIYRVALAWLLAKGPHVLPIPGASRKSSIEDSAAAADLELTEEEIARI